MQREFVEALASDVHSPCILHLHPERRASATKILLLRQSKISDLCSELAVYKYVGSCLTGKGMHCEAILPKPYATLRNHAQSTYLSSPHGELEDLPSARNVNPEKYPGE